MITYIVAALCFVFAVLPAPRLITTEPSHINDIVHTTLPYIPIVTLLIIFKYLKTQEDPLWNKMCSPKFWVPTTLSLAVLLTAVGFTQDMTETQISDIVGEWRGAAIGLSLLAAIHYSLSRKGLGNASAFFIAAMSFSMCIGLWEFLFQPIFNLRNNFPTGFWGSLIPTWIRYQLPYIVCSAVAFWLFYRRYDLKVNPKWHIITPITVFVVLVAIWGLMGFGIEIVYRPELATEGHGFVRNLPVDTLQIFVGRASKVAMACVLLAFSSAYKGRTE